MSTEVLHVDAMWPDTGALMRAASILRGGGLVAFPTETVYGLGANALDADAVLKIFAAKGRPPINPIIVHVSRADDAVPLVQHWPRSAQVLAERFWPGPLTIVLPRSNRVPDLVTAGGPTVALRVPAHPVALGLLECCELPIAAPSANRSSGLSPTRGDHVLRSLEGRFDLLLDAGPTKGGIESTVIDLTTTPPQLLRPGLVSIADLQAALGMPVSRRVFVPAASDLPLRSPGLLARHYAPRTPLELAGDTGQDRVLELSGNGIRAGWITRDGETAKAPRGIMHRVLPDDPARYSALLYAVLHELDEQELMRIVVSRPPDDDSWLAIRDRLRRASAS